MSNIVKDPAFAPSATMLKLTGLSATAASSDKNLYAAIKTAEAKKADLDVLEASAIYILKTRGAENADVMTEIGITDRDVTRKYNQGLAMYRTQEVTRTLSAVAKGELSAEAIRSATDGNASTATKIERLEALAVGNVINRRFQTTKGAAPSESLVAKATEAAISAAKANGVPATAEGFVGQLKAVSEEVGLTAKVREPQTKNIGTNSPMPVAFHLSKALTDAKQIVKDSDGLAYEPTAEDLAALLSLMAYLPGLGTDEAVSDLIADQSASVAGV